MGGLGVVLRSFGGLQRRFESSAAPTIQCPGEFARN